MAHRQGLALFLLCTVVSSSFSWPWKSAPSDQAQRVKRSDPVDCKNHLDCFKCDEIKRKNQCSTYMSLCAKTCNSACAATPFADEPYKPCADIKTQGDCLKPMPYVTALWVTICEKSCCVLDTPPKWGEWSDWGPCSKSCHYGLKTRTRQCKGAGFDQTCEGLPFESDRCNVDVPCKGLVGWVNVAVTVNEGVGDCELTIKRSRKTDCDASVTVNTNDGTAVQPGDYAKIENLLVNFTKGETEKTVKCTVNKDNLIEPLETFTAVITADPNKLDVDPGTATISIKDYTSKIGLRPARIEVKENLKIVKVTVYREGCIEGTNTVCLSTNDGTATAPSDYTAITKQNIVFAPKETSKEVSIIIVDDGIEEKDEEFYVVLGCADPSVLIVSPGKTTVVIKDDDVDGGWTEWTPYGSCSVSCAKGVQSRTRTCTNPAPQGGGKDCEGDPASSQSCNTQVCPAKLGLKPKAISVLENVRTIEVEVFRVGNAIGSNTAKLSTVDGTATSPEDFIAIVAQEITFGPNESSNNVTIKIVNDKILEGTENFQVKLTSTDAGVTEVKPDTTTVTIKDDDVQIGLDPTVYSVKETDGSVTLTVFRKGYLEETNTAIINTCDQTAIAPGDFTALKDVTVTFAPSEVSKSVNVVIINDKILEDVETFCATLTSTDDKCSIIDPKKAVISITDNDVKVGLRPDAYEIIENVESVVLKVYRIGNLKGVTTVILNTNDGTAKANEDYKPLVDFKVVFAAEETEKTFKVEIANNNIVEPLESFTVKMTTKDTDVTQILPDVATVKIIDDDAVISLGPGQCVSETVGSIKIKITRTGAINFEHTAVLNSEDGSAVTPGDYEKISALAITFAANQAEQEIEVKIIDDNEQEGPEDFKLLLTTTDDRVTVNPNAATIKIDNNDVDGKWSMWSEWGVCGKPCGQSTQSRSRVCDPAPLGGGKPCDGLAEESRPCYIVEHCPVDGGFSDWAAYGACSKTCGGGFQERLRTCTNPNPQYGGKPCVGSLNELKDCNSACCPVNGLWGNWGAWSACVSGKLSRSRECSSPAPSCGGSVCAGGAAAANESKDCPTPSPCSPGVYQPPAYDESDQVAE